MKSLRAVRKQQKLTLAQVAAKTGVSISFLSDMERGRTAPSLHTLELLAQCYDVSASYLMEDETVDTADAEELYVAIGHLVRMERDDLGFSQLELAEEIGLTRTSINNIEAGRQRLPIHVLYAIADALGVKVSCLLPSNNHSSQETS